MVDREEVKRLLDELDAYAYEVRCDWSDFDGRDLLRFVNDWREEVEAAIGPEEPEIHDIAFEHAHYAEYGPDGVCQVGPCGKRKREDD